MQQIGDMAGVATTLSNMGAMLYEQNRYEEAVSLLMHAYQILQKTGSPNVKVPERYLTAISERIGEAKYAGNPVENGMISRNTRSSVNTIKKPTIPLIETANQYILDLLTGNEVLNS
jgi:hypothetical protein